MDETVVLPEAVSAAKKREAIKVMPRLAALQPWIGVHQVIPDILELAPPRERHGKRRGERDFNTTKRLRLFFGIRLAHHADSSSDDTEDGDPTNVFIHTQQRTKGHARTILQDRVRDQYGISFSETTLRNTTSISAPVLFVGKLTNPTFRPLVDQEQNLIVKAYQLPRDVDVVDHADVLLEIVIGAGVLARLVDGFPLSVTPHIAYVLDWFIGPTCAGTVPAKASDKVQRESVAVRPSTAPTSSYDSDDDEDDNASVHTKVKVAYPVPIETYLPSKRRVDWTTPSQYVVEEYAGRSLYNAPLSLRGRVALLFQYVYSLECAFLYNGVIHNDLHNNNTLYRDVSHASSPYANRTWVYKRADPTLRTYMIPPDWHEHAFAEIIDFGRSRAWVDPSSARDEGVLAAVTRSTSYGLVSGDAHARRVLMGPQEFEEAGQNRVTPDTSRDTRAFAMTELIYGPLLDHLSTNGTDQPLLDEYAATLCHMAHLPWILSMYIDALRVNGKYDSAAYWEAELGVEIRALIKAPTPDQATMATLARRFSALAHQQETPPKNARTRHRAATADYMIALRRGIWENLFNTVITNTAVVKRAQWPTPTSTLDQPLFARFSSPSAHMDALANEKEVPLVLVGVARPNHVMAQPLTNDTSADPSTWDAFQKTYHARFVAPRMAMHTKAQLECVICGQAAIQTTLQSDGTKLHHVCSDLCARFSHTLPTMQ